MGISIRSTQASKEGVVSHWESMRGLSRDGQMFTVRTEVAEAQAVYVLGPFNNWSTTATPMRRVADGAWEVSLPEGQAMSRLSFFVWRRGERGGRLLCGVQNPTHGVSINHAEHAPRPCIRCVPQPRGAGMRSR